MTGHEKKRLKDYVETFSSLHGKRVLVDMHRSYCGSSFNSDALEMARREGRREVVLAIIRIIGEQDKMFDLDQKEDEE